MSVKVYIPVFLAKFFNGKRIIECQAGKLSDILETLSRQYSLYKNEFYEPNGRLKKYVTLFLEDKIIDNNDVESVDVKDNEKIKIYIPLIGG